MGQILDTFLELPKTHHVTRPWKQETLCGRPFVVLGDYETCTFRKTRISCWECLRRLEQWGNL